MDTTLVVVTLVIGIIGLMWFMVPIFSGIPWVPTNEKRIQAALRLAELKPGEALFDLGSGDGRVPIIAARDFGAIGVGIEISPLHCLLALFLVSRAKLSERISIRWMNYHRSDLSTADVIYFYGHSKFVENLKQHLDGRLRDGARVISIGADFPGWMPEKIDKDNLIFVYRIPPKPGDVASYMMQDAMKQKE